MPTLTRRRVRVASAAVAALAGSSLALLPAAPSQAADLTLQWRLSQYLDEHLTAQTFSGGASEDAAGVVTFTAGAAAASAGTRTVAYQGDARYAFVVAPGGAEFYSFTFSDPVVSVTPTGAGTVSADVAWTVQGVSGSAADAVLTTFTTSTSAADVLSATPRWDGVAPADTYGAGKPVEGRSWAVDFVTALPASVQATFYASGSGNDPKKAPAALRAAVPATAPAAVPQVTATVTAASPAQGVSVSVSGTGFTGVTNPGDNGVYVGVAPSGGLPATGSMADQSKFVAADWVPASALTTGTFNRSLTLPTARLDRTKAYSVYTWQAHSHSNTTQDTETPLAIGWDALKQDAAVAATWQKKPKHQRQKGRLAVAVTGPGGVPTGAVAVTLTRGKTTRTASGVLAGGSAVVKLPKLKPGTWTVTVSYAGDSGFRAAQSALTVKVKAKVKAKKPRRSAR